MLKQKSKTPTFISRGLLLVVSLAVFVAGVSQLVVRQNTVLAATNGTINFQARLLTAAGNVVPDGVYNVELKLYSAATSSGSSQGSCSGDSACKWTETRTDGNKVTVKNGYLTVNLGSVTAFGSGINWDQEHWLTMNIGGTGSPAWDGEMNPRLKLTSVPYAFRSGAVVSADGTGVLTAANGESGTICVQNSVNCGFVQGEATDFIQNSPTSAQAANIHIQSVDVAKVGAIIQAKPGQTADILQLQSSGSTSMLRVANNGATTLQNATDSTAAFRVRNAAGSIDLLNIDTSGQVVTIRGSMIAPSASAYTRATNTPAWVELGRRFKGTGNLSTPDRLEIEITGGEYEGDGSTVYNIEFRDNIVVKRHDYNGGANNSLYALKVYAEDAKATGAEDKHMVGFSLGNGAAFYSFNIRARELSDGQWININTATEPTTGYTNVTPAINYGEFTAGTAAFRSASNNTQAFRVLNADALPVFNIDTTSSNLISNSSFETVGTTGWSGHGGAPAPVTTLTAHYDNDNALQVTTTGAGQGAKYNYALKPNTQYSFSMFVLPSGPDVPLSPEISTLEVGYSGNGSTDTSCATGQEAWLSAWTRIRCTFTTGSSVSGTTYVYIKQTDAVGRTFYMDAVQLEEAAAATTYRNSTATIGSSLAINYGPLDAKAANAALVVRSLHGGHGLVLKGGGSTSIFNNLLDVQVPDPVLTQSDISLLRVNEPARSTYIRGGSSFFNTVALDVAAVDDNVNVVKISGRNGGNGTLLHLQGGSSPGANADFIKLQDAASNTVFKVGNSGQATFQSTSNSNTAFRILNSSGTAMFTLNTSGTDNGIYVAGDGTNGAAGRIFFGAPGNSGVWIGEDGSTDSNVLALNGTSGLNILANNTSVATISSNGAFALQNSTDSNFAFTIKTQSGSGIMRVDSSARKIAVGNYSSTAADNITGQLEILPVHDNRVGLTIKGFSATYVARYMEVTNSAGSNVFRLSADGNIETASGVFMSTVQTAASTSSSSTSFKSGDVSGSGSNSGGATFKSGNSTSSGNTGSVTLVSGDATSGNSGSITIDSGTATGTTGGIFIGTNNAASLSFGNAAKAQTLNIGASSSTAGSSTVRIANSTSALNTQSVSIGSSANAASSLTLEAGNTGGINIGAGATAHTINIGTGAAAQVITIGSTSGASETKIYSGSAGTTFKSTSSATAFRILNSSASDIPLFTVDSSASRVYIGNPTSDTTGALLVLDTKSDAGDPTGVAGAMYYNSSMGKFRCYENGAWVNCLSGLNDAVTVESEQSGSVSNSGSATNSAYAVPSQLNSATFIAPPSGKVMVTWAGESQGNATTTWVRLSPEVRTGGVVGSGTVVLSASDEYSTIQWGTTTSRNTGAKLLTGLTPGSTYNIRILWKTNPTTGNFMNKQTLQVTPTW